MIGEEVYFLSGKNEWQIGIVTGTTDTGRSYNILTDKGTSLRMKRSHLKPRCHDIPVISRTFPCRTSTSSQSETTENWLLLYFRDTVSTEECHQAEEADQVCRGPSEQCQDHTSKEDQVTPSQMDHQNLCPGLADTNRVVTSQGRK